MTNNKMNNQATVNAERAISAATRAEADFTVYAHKVSPILHRHTETVLGKTRKYSNKAYKHRNEMLKAGAVSGTAGVVIGMLAPVAAKGIANGLKAILPKKKVKIDHQYHQPDDLDDDFDLDEEIDEEEDD